MEKSVWLLIILGMLLLGGVLAGMSYLSPLFEPFPQPTGPFAVGECFFGIQDTSKHTMVMVDLYYPSERGDTTQKFPYQPAALRALAYEKAVATNLPVWLWRYLVSGVMSYTKPEAPVSEKGLFPVIVFMPGIAGDSLYNVYIEELVSHGYVVVSLKVPGDVSVIVTPKKVIWLNEEFKKSIASGDREAIYAYRRAAHSRWKEILVKVLDKLEVLASMSGQPFYKKIDLTKIGLLGHSHGGGVVTDFCAQDERCISGVNMDGWTKGAQRTEGFDKPFLLLANEHGINELEELAKNMPSAEYKKIPGAGHGAFSDMVLLKQPLRWYLGITTDDPVKVRTAIQQELVNFFDRTLKQKK